MAERGRGGVQAREFVISSFPPYLHAVPGAAAAGPSEAAKRKESNSGLLKKLRLAGWSPGGLPLADSCAAQTRAPDLLLFFRAEHNRPRSSGADAGYLKILGVPDAHEEGDMRFHTSGQPNPGLLVPQFGVHTDPALVPGALCEPFALERQPCSLETKPTSYT